MTVFVQFSDNTKKNIISVFSSPQDPDNYPNYLEIEETDTELYAIYEEFMNNVKRPFGI